MAHWPFCFVHRQSPSSLFGFFDFVWVSARSFLPARQNAVSRRAFSLGDKRARQVAHKMPNLSDERELGE